MSFNNAYKLVRISNELKKIDQIAQMLSDSVDNRLSNGKTALHNEFIIRFLSRKISVLNKKYERLLDEYFSKIVT